MKRLAIAILLLCVYLAIVFPMADHMSNRPVAVKLGYMPNAQVLKLVSVSIVLRSLHSVS